MCRLSAVIGGGWTPYSRMVAMHQLLMLSMADGGHEDGTGISDGRAVWKTANNAWTVDATTWESTIDKTAPILMGHVRKRSTGTGNKDADAHPYLFEVGENKTPFVMAHNGFFSGVTGGYTHGEPDTDTWRAGKILAKMLESRPLDDDTISEWLGNFTATSAFSLLMMWEGKLHIVRGKDRPLAFTIMNSTPEDAAAILTAPTKPASLLINTSVAALRGVRNLLKFQLGIDLSPVIEFGEGTYAVIAQNGVVEYASRLEWKFRSYVSTTYVTPAHIGGTQSSYFGSSSASTTTSNTTQNSTPTASKEASSSIRSVTVLGSDTGVDAAAAFSRWSRLGILKWFRKCFAPMSSTLIYRWARHFHGKSPDDKDGLSFEELVSFYEGVVPQFPVKMSTLLAIGSNDTAVTLLSQPAKEMIVLWNALVPANDEGKVFSLIEVPFWLPSHGWDKNRLQGEVEHALDRI